MQPSNNDMFSQLQNEFLGVQESLKAVDENIKRLTGRDPTENRQNQKRSIGNEEFPAKSGKWGEHPAHHQRTENLHVPYDLYTGNGLQQSPTQRFRGQGAYRSGFVRLPRIGRSRPQNSQYESPDEDEPPHKVSVQSSVVATPKEVRSRRDTLETQKGDKKVMDRNRRMFGMILGTLQKFQSEESTRKGQSEKRAVIEQKLEEAASKEKEEIRKERAELFVARRQKQAQIRCLEQKIEIAQLHEEWEKRQNQMAGFIFTKSEPHLAYRPKKHSSETDKRLKETKERVQEQIKQQRALISIQLQEIDNLYNKSQTIIDEEEEPVENLLDKENLGPHNTDESKEAENEVSLDMQIDQTETELPVQEIPLDHPELEEIPVPEGSNVKVEESFEINADGKNEETLGDQEFEPIYD